MTAGRGPDTEAELLARIRRGEADASRRFVSEQYPAIYQYLLYLTGQPDLAADLTQETFLQAWRHLDTFQGRASLRTWLHRIARREFLEALRARRAEVALEAVSELAAPGAGAWREGIELHDAIDALPLPQREVVLLHYLEGYATAEIARIVEAPVGTVCDRLARARERLRLALGEDDLTHLNDPLAPMRQWAWLPLERMRALETRLTVDTTASKENAMERREFLRQAAAGAAGLALPEAGKEIVDGRLTKKVTLAFKATALSDLCDHLRAETGVQIAAGASVADEKVTLFCKQTPLRDVMRQLSRPFGYAWERSTRSGQHRYELVQDLRSQLLEEELRNRDRHAALLALDRDVERYRPYLSLSPIEALERLKTATEAEKPLLEKLGGRAQQGQFGLGWGPIHMYFRLSRAEQEALRAGQELFFTTKPEPGERSLPSEVARGVFESYRDFRIPPPSVVREFVRIPAGPDHLPLADVPEVAVGVSLRIDSSELGTLRLDGLSRVYFPKGAGLNGGTGPYASGRSPAIERPENDRLSARFAVEPVLRPRVTVEPKPSYRPVTLPTGAAVPEPKVTSADLLEAFHHATGLPVVGDYYTRLYSPARVSARNVPLHQALNQLSDAMRLRWALADGGTAAQRWSWLQFRSVSYYDDRLKEVPNRLLARWAASRQQKGFLSLDDLVEIAGLPDPQLDAREMAEGAREILGLDEWDLPARITLRPYLRDLTLFTPEQRRQAMTDEGLPFVKMTLPQQQQFIRHATLYTPLSPEALTGARLRIDYSRPGEFQWGHPGMNGSWTRWFVIREPGRPGSWAPRPTVRARTREEVLEALRRLDPALRDAAVHRQPMEAEQLASAPQAPVPLEAQIFPTDLNLVFVYIPSSSNEYVIQIMHRYGQSGQLLF